MTGSQPDPLDGIGCRPSVSSLGSFDFDTDIAHVVPITKCLHGTEELIRRKLSQMPVIVSASCLAFSGAVVTAMTK